MERTGTGLVQYCISDWIGQETSTRGAGEHVTPHWQRPRGFVFGEGTTRNKRLRRDPDVPLELGEQVRSPSPDGGSTSAGKGPKRLLKALDLIHYNSTTHPKLLAGCSKSVVQ